MQSKQIENIVVDEANQRTYIVLAPRVLSDGEIYRAIRRDILKRGALPTAGETLTISLTPSEPTRAPPPGLPGREQLSVLAADQVASRPQPMTGSAQARSLPGEST